MPRSAPATCPAPGRDPGTPCGLPVYAHGLCASHTKQRQRKRPLTPLRDSSAPPLARVSLRVSPECRERVLAKPAAARLLLEHWARTVR